MNDRLQRSVRVTVTGLVTNGILAIVKLATGLVGHSAALVADAIESVADMAAAVIVWRAVVIADRPADEDHPYGHGKAETVATAAVAVLLLGAAGLIVLGAVREILTPHHPPKGYTLVVLLGVVLVKEGLFRIVSRVGDAVESAVVKADAWHHRSDAITSAAAALGISVALIGGEKYEAADEWAAMFTAVIIAWNGYRLLRPAVGELMDEAPTDDVVPRATAVAQAVAGVKAVEKCFARKMGYNFVLDMHVEVDGAMTVEAAHQLAHDVKNTIRTQLPRVSEVTIHVEPHARHSV